MSLCGHCLRKKTWGESLLGFVALASFATAAPLAITWQGGSQGEWHTPGNWSPAVIPGGLDGDEHSATISFAAVALGEDVQLGSLLVNGTTLSGAHMLRCVDPEGLVLSGANTFASDLGVVALGPLSFADDTASLVNHGSIWLGFADPLQTIGSSPVVGTLTNASDGTIRFNPNPVEEIPIENSDPLIWPILVGSPNAFRLVNEGTIIADESRSVDFYAVIKQTATGHLVARASSSIGFWAGGTLAGNIQVAPTAQVRLWSLSAPYTEPIIAYTLDDAVFSGGGSVSVNNVVLSGPLQLGSGACDIKDSTLEDGIINHGDLSLSSTNVGGDVVNHPGAFLRWLYGTTISLNRRITNHGTFQFDQGNNFFGSGFLDTLATINNASDGVIRFDPAGVGRIGSVIGFQNIKIENAGTLLSDNPTSPYAPSNVILAPLINSGLIRVTAGSALTITPTTFSQTAGETRVEDAELTGSGTVPLTFAGGLLRATGKVNGPVVLGSEAALEIGPAQTAGTLRFSHSLTLSPGALVHLDLVSTHDGGNDRVLVTGALQLDGRLRIRLTPDLAATLTPETTFTVATAGTIAGTFANIHAGRVWTTDGAGSFQVTQTTVSVGLIDYRPSPAFEAWQHRYWPDAADPTVDGNPDADPDGDGIPNLLEYALGLPPATATTIGLPIIENISSDLSLTYTRACPDVTYTVETTTDLAAAWTTTGVTQGTPDANGLTTATVPFDAPRRYLRLKVTLIP